MLFVSLLFADMSHAVVDANTATAVELEAVNGIGPATAARILAERQRAPFRDTEDLQRRVKGIGPVKLRKMEADGLTVRSGQRAAWMHLDTAGPPGTDAVVIDAPAAAGRGRVTEHYVGGRSAPVNARPHRNAVSANRSGLK